MANVGAWTDPYAVTLDPGVKTGNPTTSIGISTLDARHALGALAAPSPGDTFGYQTGVFPDGTSGPGVNNALAGFAAGGMTTACYAGAYQVDRGALGAYWGAATASNWAWLPGASNYGHAASNPSNPRLDLVVVRTRDPHGVAADAGATESAKLVIIQGDAAANPTLPTAKLTSGDVPLYQVTVRAGATAIAGTDLADLRRMVVARGGITPRVPGDDRPGAYEGQYRDNIELDQLERWSGTEWEAIAVPSQWRTFTPRLICDGTGTDIGLGSNATYNGKYQLVGHTLNFNLFFKWGSSPFNGGYGDIHSYLPKHPISQKQMYGAAYSQWVPCHLWVNNDKFVGDFSGLALVHANSSLITPFFPICSGHFPPNFPINMNTKPFKIADTAAKAASGVPRIFNPDGYPEGGDLEIGVGSVEVTW